MSDELVKRLRQRALARVSLRKPSKIDATDAELDNAAADEIVALERGWIRMAEEIERLTARVAELEAIIAANGKLASDFNLIAAQRENARMAAWREGK